jgi:TusA-related sulfurtransferase
MKKATKSVGSIKINFFLDITEEVCPMTFVKTKLLIEQMQPGQVVEVRLRGKEPLENVPRSVKDYGHEIISLKAENPSQSTDCAHRLIIKKINISSSLEK